MKNRLKKTWFSLLCYISAILLAAYSLVGAWFLDDEIWWMTTQIISTLSCCLLLIVIGVANMPRKENKDE
ncbi:MAG: hypothetical protein J6S85_20830 [Methanobrevibacter sp.]|nr:hypothetical protein [Methanobrevibacter sp.]